MTGEPAYPGPSAAIGLVVAAFGAMLLVLLMLTDPGTPPVAAVQGLALVAGFGFVGTLAARRVPPPQSERLGLRGFPPAFVVAVLLLVPVTLLASEVESLLHTLWMPPDAEEIAQRMTESLSQATVIDALETWVLVVGLAPVVEEWFYRGVLQQGLVAWLGVRQGVLASALLFAVPHAGFGMSWQAAIAIAAATSVQGLAFALVRQTSGSLLPAVLLHAGCNALGLSALAVSDVLVIPSFNAPGDHLPGEWIVLALVCVALGLALCARLARRVRPMAAAALAPAPGAEDR